ncbi:hypothetical protein [Actinomarinicola tropica]|uniref:Uncharacterized protein n=1 Tax=Actinomarinicola tropica TaxID=2789776 RepID=A0A5Q2RJ96_9ACTN|nr:hypothetical protein [Actinomarinicola tropica]QGG96849.1 hypothetical protein GH723_18060 [Actinomarinicola tropica]
MTVALAVLAVLVVVLLVRLVGVHPGGATLVPALLGPRRPTPQERPEGLARWESAMLAAGTSGGRGRARLARQLEPLVATTLLGRHGLAMGDPRAADLLGAEWRYLTGDGPQPPTAPGEGTAAVVAAVEVLLDRLEAGGGSDRG